MPPVVRAGVGSIDPDLLDGVDRLQHALDPRPPGGSQEDLATGRHIGDRREALAAPDRAQNIDPGNDGAEVARRPSDVGDDTVRREAQDAAAAVEDLLADVAAEADPVLDPLLMPDQFDVGERVPMRAGAAHDAPPGNFPPSRPRSTSEELDSESLDSELGLPEDADPAE